MADKNFDDLAEHFMQKIYAGPKGRIRLAVLQHDLQQQGLFDLSSGSVLDAGGGFGMLSRQFAQNGMQVTICDLSSKLLGQAAKDYNELGLASRLTTVNGAFQTIEEEYDVVLCHAVMEWLDEPMKALERLCKQTKIGGHLSLMFFNHTALVWKNLLFGKFTKVRKQKLSGLGTSLTPQHSFHRSEIQSRLEELGFALHCCSGVRLIRDYMKEDVIKRVGEEAIEKMELEFSRQEPYMEMARYIHFVAQRKR